MMDSKEIRTDEMWVSTLQEPCYALLITKKQIKRASHTVRLYMYLN